MRITRFEASKVGRWASTTLAFAPGLNLVFGPNEAGKSTALRAIEATLFAVPTDELKPLVSPRSATQFEATITLERDGEAGPESIAWRRAGKVLVDASGAPLSPEIQHAWLWETSRSDFRAIYALGNDRLRDRHGLLGKGNTLGRVLTEIAAGGRDIATVQARFQADLERHYTPLGRNKPHFARALGEVRAASDRIREADLARGHKAYAQAEASARSARELVAHTDASIEERRGRLRELDRLLFVPGGLAQIAALELRLDGLHATGPVPDAAWASATRALRDRQANIVVELTNAGTALAEAARALEGLSPSAAVLSHEDRIGAIIASRAVLVEAPARQARLATQLRTCVGRLEASLVGMGLADPTVAVESPAALGRYVPPEHARLALSRAYKTLLEAEDAERQLRKLVGDARQRADEERAAFAGMGGTIEVASLRALRTEIGEQPTPQAQKARGIALVARAHDLSATAARLGFPDGQPLAEHRRLRVPGEEPLRALSLRYEAAQADRQRAEAALRDALAAEATDAKRLDEHERALPQTAAHADLEGARTARDEAWRALRLAEAAGQPAPVRADLSLTYEARTRALDTTVDAVLRHADAVAQLAELRRTLESRKRDVAARARALAATETSRDAVLSAWHELWAPLAAARFSPPHIEQTTFTRDHAHFIKELDNLLRDQASFAGEESAQQEAREKLRRALLAAGLETPESASFATLLAQLDDRIADGLGHNASLAAARALADKMAIDAQRQSDRLAAAALATAEAHRAFETTLSEIALPESARADQDKLHLWIADGKALVDQLREVQEAERALAEEATGATERDAQRKAVLSLLAAELRIDESASPLAQTDALAAALGRAREARVLEQARDKAEAALGARQRAARSFAQEWAAHLAAAGLPALSPDGEDLERCLERSDAAVTASRDLARQRSQLEAEAGEPVAALRARLGARSKDDLDHEQQALVAELKQLEERRNTVQKAAIEAETAFRALGTLGDHDALRQDHEAALALLAEELAETLTLKGASLLLTELSEELAHTDHRAALLARASAYLGRLTGGSFHTLHADDEEAALTVTRAGDDETLGVDALSEGTRDQVFLALRLAVAHRQLTDKRLPFVLDDVLVHFDDGRAAAALAAFAELAEHTQIILFTHHRHLFDVASSAGVPFHAIELPAPLAGSAPREPSASETIDAPKPVPRAPKKPRAVVQEAGPELLALAPEGAEELFLDKLRELGGSAGNGKLRGALAWEESVYDEVKAALVAASKLELGKGRGGSVKLVEQLAIL